MDGQWACETAFGEDEPGGLTLAQAGAGRVIAMAAVVLVAIGLALLPVAVGLRLIPLGGEQLAAVLGGATLVVAAAKFVALTWAVAVRCWPVHPVRLANVRLD